MRIVAVSDTHTFHRQVPQIPGDVLVFAGDYDLFGANKCWADFVAWINAYPCKHKIFVPGNHDVRFQERENAARLEFAINVRVLQSEGVTIKGVKFWGSPWTPWYHDWAYNFPKGNAGVMKAHWSLVPEDVDVLVTHGPPLGIGDDWVGDDKEVIRIGDAHLRDRVFKLPRIKHHIFGHNHAGYGQQVHEGITFSNVAFVDNDRVPANPPIIIDL